MKYVNRLHQIQRERMEEKRKIKKEFVDTGDADAMIDAVRKKRDDRPSVDSLPF